MENLRTTYRNACIDLYVKTKTVMSSERGGITRNEALALAGGLIFLAGTTLAVKYGPKLAGDWIVNTAMDKLIGPAPLPQTQPDVAASLNSQLNFETLAGPSLGIPLFVEQLVEGLQGVLVDGIKSLQG